MDGLSLLREAQAAGLRVAAQGDKLVIRGPRQAEPIARRLIASKPTVMAALKRSSNPPAFRLFGPAGDDPAGWRAWLEERTQLRRVDSAYDTAMAARLAYGELVEVWRERHPVAHDRMCCAGCGKALAADVLDLPGGARVHFEQDREFGCLITYGAHWRAAAADGLRRIGIEPPEGWTA